MFVTMEIVESGRARFLSAISIIMKLSLSVLLSDYQYCTKASGHKEKDSASFFKHLTISYHIPLEVK